MNVKVSTPMPATDNAVRSAPIAQNGNATSAVPASVSVNPVRAGRAGARGFRSG